MAKLKSPLLRWASRAYAEAEGGLHTDIFRAAILMLEAGYDETTTFSFLRSAASSVGDRSVPDREIQSAIAYANNRIAGGGTNNPRWPKFESVYRNEIVAKHGDLLPRLSANSINLSQDPAFYIKALYAPTDLVCVAMSSDSHLTLPRDTIAAADNLGDVEYINPSPMVKPFGRTQERTPQFPEGKESAHCLDNTGPKRYQVIEFDFGPPHEHAAILWHLGSKLPLVLIVYSGGKSMHGWFVVSGVPEEVVIEFFNEAVNLGADPKMWSRCQFSRMPCGTNNKTQRQQTVTLFNPDFL